MITQDKTRQTKIQYLMLTRSSILPDASNVVLNEEVGRRGLGGLSPEPEVLGLAALCALRHRPVVQAQRTGGPGELSLGMARGYITLWLLVGKGGCKAL